MEPEEKLKLDYEQTLEYFHALADVRFKLLAALPTVTGAAVAVLQVQKPELVIPISLFGLLVTFGLICYDQRNSQIYNAMQRRAKSLEALLGFESVSGRFRHGGALLDRPIRSSRFFGLLMWHDRGLSVVYSASLAAWSYLLVNSLVQAGQVQFIRIGAPILVFVAAFAQLQSLDEATDSLGALPEHIKRLLDQRDPDE